MYIRKTYNCIEDLILSILSTDYKGNISIICKYDSARYVLKAMCDGTDLLPTHVFLESSDWEGYNKEFIISTLGNDIYCERFYKDRYIHLGDDTVFILPGCSQECIKHIQNELEDCQICEEVELDCELSDCGDESTDIIIGVGDDVVKIGIASVQEFVEIAQRVLPRIAHILDALDF